MQAEAFLEILVSVMEDDEAQPRERGEPHLRLGCGGVDLGRTSGGVRGIGLGMRRVERGQFGRDGFEPGLAVLRVEPGMRVDPAMVMVVGFGRGVVMAGIGRMIPGIVARSAEHRRIIAEIDPFWTTHPEADTRFAAWMRRSLTLTDRDMLVTGAPEMQGYAIAQPASRLHFPPSHPITGIGVIDDFYHTDLADPAHLADNGAGAASLLCAAEAALARRGVGAAFVVCPAEWPSKVGLLHQAGYTTAMEWLVKR